MGTAQNSFFEIHFLKFTLQNSLFENHKKITEKIAPSPQKIPTY